MFLPPASSPLQPITSSLSSVTIHAVSLLRSEGVSALTSQSSYSEIRLAYIPRYITHKGRSDPTLTRKSIFLLSSTFTHHLSSHYLPSFISLSVSNAPCRTFCTLLLFDVVLVLTSQFASSSFEITREHITWAGDLNDSI